MEHYPVHLTHRPLLEEVGIFYVEGKRKSGVGGQRGRVPALLVEPWVAAIMNLNGAPVAVFEVDDRRPQWQKKRLFRLAAIAWARADEKHRDALDAAFTIPIGGRAAAAQLLAAQVVVTKETPYPFQRRGQRTQEACRTRRSVISTPAKAASLVITKAK